MALDTPLDVNESPSASPPLPAVEELLAENARLRAECEALRHTEVELAQSRSELKDSRDQLEAILRGVTDGITVLDPTGRFIYANLAGAQLCGFQSVEEFLQAPTAKVMERFEIMDEHGNPFPTEKLPGRQALQGMKQVPEVVLLCRDKETNEKRWAIVGASAIVGMNGKVKFAISIFRDFTSHKESEEALRQAIRLRDEFLSIASHELRTPLTPLRLRLQTLRQFLLGDLLKSHPELCERIIETSEVADRQVRRLTSLVDNLLDASRMTDVGPALTLESVDLVDLVAEVVERYRAQLASSGCDSEVHLPAEPVMIQCDRLRVEQVLVNLLANAMKYAPGKPVAISLESDPGEVRLSVRDQGIGIAEADQPRIFKRFERIRSRQNVGGLGLGLYICRQIADAHGGRLAVESRPGKGATFVVTLPRNPAGSGG